MKYSIDDGRTAVTDNYLRVPVPEGRSRNEWVSVVVPAAGGVGAATQ